MKVRFRGEEYPAVTPTLADAIALKVQAGISLADMEEALKPLQDLDGETDEAKIEAAGKALMGDVEGMQALAASVWFAVRHVDPTVTFQDVLEGVELPDLAELWVLEPGDEPEETEDPTKPRTSRGGAAAGGNRAARRAAGAKGSGSSTTRKHTSTSV